MADSSSTQEQTSCGEIGTCATCRKACALLRSGNTHQHGPRNKPCPGSGKPPCSSKVTPTRATEVSAARCLAFQLTGHFDTSSDHAACQ